MHFFDYHCPACGNEDVFIDVVRLDGESTEQFEARKVELETTARQVRAEQVHGIRSTGGAAGVDCQWSRRRRPRGPEAPPSISATMLDIRIAVPEKLKMPLMVLAVIVAVP